MNSLSVNFLSCRPTNTTTIVLLWFSSAQSTTTAYSSWTRTNTLSIADPSLQVLPSSNLTPEINDKYDCLLAAVLW